LMDSVERAACLPERALIRWRRLAKLAVLLCLSLAGR
jgi:hypothetical protein